MLSSFKSRVRPGQLRELVLIVLIISAGVWASSRYTRLGLATKAAAENEKGAIILGYSPQRLAQTSFVLASLIGGLVVILASPMIQLTSAVLTFSSPTLIGRRSRSE